MEHSYNQTTDLFVQEPVVYAGFGERLGAAIIDGIILCVVNIALFFLMPRGVGNVLGLVTGWLYYALQESGPQQATIGKKAVNVKVISLEGERISFGQATGR